MFCPFHFHSKLYERVAGVNILYTIPHIITICISIFRYGSSPGFAWSCSASSTSGNLNFHFNIYCRHLLSLSIHEDNSS